MKVLIFLFIFFILTECTNNKSVYWCGDHACINKAEQKEYFKKTMIVEVRDIKKIKHKKKSEIEIITQQAEVGKKKNSNNENQLANKSKFEEKKRIYEEKVLAKQTEIKEELTKEKKTLTEKTKLEEEKLIFEEIKKEEKLIIEEIKEEERIYKNQTLKDKNILKSDNTLKKYNKSDNLDINKFDKAAEKIIKKNTLRPYPDINDIPI